MSGVAIGGLIVLVGILLLLDNFRIIRFHDLLDYWPVGLIVFGVARIIEARSTSSYIWGGMLALFGALLLLDNLNFLNFEFNLLWPLLIIGFGVSMLVRTMDRKRVLAAGPDSAGASNPSLGMWAIFSGFKRRIDTQDFQGGEIVAVFGGVQIDLRHAGISGDRAVIDVNALFGGVDIRVPETWSVVMRGVGIFGAFEDKTLHPKPDANVKTPELVITGCGMFAGIKTDN